MLYTILSSFVCLSVLSTVIWTINKRFLDTQIKILFRDTNFLLIYKHYDLRINSNDKKLPTVETYLRKACPNLVNDNLCHNFYFVHRLDYATSGVMCIPLNKYACKVIAHAFRERTSRKYYIAILRGFVSEECLDVNISIGEDTANQHIQKMCTLDNENCVHPKTARTVFLTLEHGICYDYPATKVLIRPITGRRHQIRLHSAYLGHHIVGDFTYSNKKDIMPSRMYLHALRLVLPNPITNLDVITEDPFIMNDWKPFKTLNELSEKTFKKLDTVISSSDTRRMLY